MFSTLTKIIASFFLGLASLFGASQNYGSASNTSPAGAVVSVYESYLASQQATGDTTMTLASGSLRDGTSLSGYACFTVDSNTSTLEYECGTVSGTSVTGILRGIDATTGTTSVASLIYAHRRGADVKITDYPALTIATNQLNGTQTIPNELQYANTVLIGTNDASTTVATKYYVDTQGTVGLVNATTLVRGIVQFATAAQAALGTILGTTGANLALPASMATSTPGVQGTNVIPVTGTNNKLSQLFLDLTQGFSVSGLWNFSATTTMATSTVASSTITNFNNTTLANFMGTANFYGATTGLSGKFYLNTSPGTIGGTSSTTIFSVSIPANTLSSSNFLTFNIPLSAFNLGTDKFLAQVGYNGATTSVSMYQSVAGGLGGGNAQITLAGNGSTGSQLITLYVSGSGFASSTASTISVDSTGVHQLVMIVQSPNYGGADSFIPILVSGVLSK